MKQFLVLLGIGVVLAGVVVMGVENPGAKVEAPPAPIPFLDYASPDYPNGSFEAAADSPAGWTIAGGPDLR